MKDDLNLHDDLLGDAIAIFIGIVAGALVAGLMRLATVAMP